VADYLAWKRHWKNTTLNSGRVPRSAGVAAEPASWLKHARSVAAAGVLLATVPGLLSS